MNELIYRKIQRILIHGQLLLTKPIMDNLVYKANVIRRTHRTYVKQTEDRKIELFYEEQNGCVKQNNMYIFGYFDDLSDKHPFINYAVSFDKSLEAEIAKFFEFTKKQGGNLCFTHWC